ncbi:MAG: glycoside hydrolase, partial [Acidobacteriota bacterium]|nr:glycoside hydrolase [Acidobacteriota bacterium]
PFECELTHAAHAGGHNLLAIRITNPFGRYDWVDGLNAQWGAVRLYRSHGFGGLDRGMSLSTAASVRIQDLWVLNRLERGRVQVNVAVESPSGVADVDQVRLQIIDPSNGHVVAESGDLASGHAGLQVALVDGADGTATRQTVTAEMTAPQAALWDLDTPTLYHLRAEVRTRSGHTDTRTVAFGFRTFQPVGIGTNAMFRLNGRRIRIYTSISWGFWGLNGLFPTPELAEKEVRQAKALNLNCLNFHRNVGKEDVLRAHDRLGLLRYMEPGGGKLSIGAPAPTASGEGAIANPGVKLARPTSAADRFAQRFMVAKCVAMVRAFRSHPSLIQYTVQNEIGADLANPDVFAVLQAMHREDPSRLVVLNDGFSPPPRSAAQAWYEPWSDTIHRSDRQPFAGWWNNHQGAGDQWYDEFYKSPTEFTYRAPYREWLTEYGEMEGCATPDNHSLMIHQITTTYAKYGGLSYDLTDHKQIVAAYDRFLDQWGFRNAFPATEQLWLALGTKCYQSWQNYLENARISDELDFAAISGWESTAIENHSGIVDNLRNFKADPAPIARTLQPVYPVAKQRSLCVALGQPATFDLYLLNDTGKPVSGSLRFSMVTPSGRLLQLTKLPAPEQSPDQFSYLLQQEFQTPPLTEEGMYRFRFSLSSHPLATQTREIWVADTRRQPHRPLTVAVSGVTPALQRQLSALPGVSVVPWRPQVACDVIVASGLTSHTSADQRSGDTTGLEAQPASVVGAVQTSQQVGSLAAGVLEAVTGGTPLLAMPQADTLSDGVARQLAEAGAFTYLGTVGDFRAPWMGNWYFVRQHPLYAGMPVNQAMGIHYQARGRQANGLLLARHPQGAPVEIVAAYSRDHDRNIGAGTFTTQLGRGRVVYQRVPELHPILQQRFLANALQWLTT